MAARDPFGEHLGELLLPLGPVSVRRMFGGSGVFLDGLMFALVIEDCLYFKVDDGNRQDFVAESLLPFRYQKSTGQVVVMSYWRTPERLLDEPEELLEWARKAVAAARRGPVKRPRRA